MDNKVRVIAGAYKGLTLSVLDANGLRPTTDRARESLFNLIQNKVVNAKVLDLFAGSAILGLEALSRGANEATFVELNKDTFSLIKEEFLKHKIKNCEIINKDALSFLQETKDKFDLIFLDPPYQSDLLEKALDIILKRDLIYDDSILYVEYQSQLNKSFKGLELINEQKFGQIKFAFYKKSSFLF